MPRTDEQVLQREMQADAEHQQDDADLGELAAQAPVGDEAGRVGTDEHAGDEIADERRQPQPVGAGPEDNASTSPATMVEISGVSCGMRRCSDPGGPPWRHYSVTGSI